MEINETRRKLIDIIASFQVTQAGRKLPIGKLSLQAGISRQAFNRYYNDLKDYAYGVKPIGDLISNTTGEQTKELINKNQASLKDLQRQIDRMDAQHTSKLKSTVDSYVTSLMMNDLTMHGANELRVTLEKQSLYNNDLKNQLSKLEIQLANARALAQKQLNFNTSGKLATGNKLKVDIDLSKAFERYTLTHSSDELEEQRQAELSRTLKSIKKLVTNNSCSIIIYAERYLSRFSVFFDKYKCRNEEPHIIIRTPIFDRTSFKLFLSQLPQTSFLAVHIPHSKSDIETKAQRSFYFGNIPDIELLHADRADPISMSLNFDEIIHFRVRQGD
jgi:hypothetical protein